MILRLSPSLYELRVRRLNFVGSDRVLNVRVCVNEWVNICDRWMLPVKPPRVP